MVASSVDWIPVDQQDPPESGAYLVYTRKDTNNRRPTLIDIYWYSDETEQYPGWIRTDVTHWALLPDVPEQEVS